MKNVLCCAFAMVFLSVPMTGFAQGDHPENSLVAGSKALLFQMASNIKLTEFNGANFSVKRHTSPGGTWRVGLTTSASTSDDESKQVADYDSVQYDRTRETDVDKLAIGVAVERLRYLTPDRPLSLFVGCGPSLSVARDSRNSRETVENTIPTKPESVYRSESVSKSVSLGIGAVIGVEWFPHEQIGILGQYGSLVVYKWSKTESENSQPTGPVQRLHQTQNALDFRAEAVRLGIALYW